MFFNGVCFVVCGSGLAFLSALVFGLRRDPGGFVFLVSALALGLVGYLMMAIGLLQPADGKESSWGRWAAFVAVTISFGLKAFYMAFMVGVIWLAAPAMCQMARGFRQRRQQAKTAGR